LTSSYHVPVLADAVRDWTAAGRRIVDATVGGGGHAALFRELGAEVLAVDRDPEAIAAARARLGDTGIRYSSGPFGSAKVLGSIETFPTGSSSISASRPTSSIATPGGLPFVPARRSTCEWRRDTA